MSQSTRRKVSLLALPSLGVAGCLITFWVYSMAQGQSHLGGPGAGAPTPQPNIPNPIEPSGTMASPRMKIGPIPGLTTAWHAAPEQTGVPLGATVQFKVTGLSPTTPVTWTGAVEVQRGFTFSRP